MDRARIAELLAPFLEPEETGEQLTEDDLQNISTYIDILERWNLRINLSAIRDPEEIVTRHFGESFFAARQIFPGRHAGSPERSVSLADVGSGAGFPGIPIKLWAHGISLTLIESNQKKTTFLREVCRALQLSEAKVENCRAEAIAPAAFDVVTLRAVERFAEALPAAARLVRPSGELVLLISSAQIEAARSLAANFSWREPKPVPLSQARVVLIGERESSSITGGR